MKAPYRNSDLLTPSMKEIINSIQCQLKKETDSMLTCLNPQNQIKMLHHQKKYGKKDDTNNNRYFST